MAFHSEIKVNYHVLQEIVADLKKHEVEHLSDLMKKGNRFSRDSVWAEVLEGFWI